MRRWKFSEKNKENLKVGRSLIVRDSRERRMIS